MEFLLERRESFCITDKEEEISKHPPFNPPDSSPSPASTAFKWHDSSSGGGGDFSFVEKEHMFDKVVTPSDVGKLNRLVIPKQHAEKYFPLDMSASEKGLLLSFEDRTGKHWRFRYSYWNSSQSYVMTKGWSRFVKEKGLGAGDTVSFGRGAVDAARHRLYIDWNRRPERRGPAGFPLPGFCFDRSTGPWSARFIVPPAGACDHTWQRRTYNAANSGIGAGQLLLPLYFTLPAPKPPQMEVQQVASGRVPLVHDHAAVKRVRLFGVNLDCPDQGDDANYHSSVQQLRPTTALPLLQPLRAESQTLLASSSSQMSNQQQRRQDGAVCPHLASMVVQVLGFGERRLDGRKVFDPRPLPHTMFSERGVAETEVTPERVSFPRLGFLFIASLYSGSPAPPPLPLEREEKIAAESSAGFCCLRFANGSLLIAFAVERLVGAVGPVARGPHGPAQDPACPGLCRGVL
ncbi:hypothetical protein BHM03_00035280 [Ensete ventricosum]|nr:hypothetical protein BHM03_00035280 [Ensete ventricosum]